ncbi:MAG: hypothetical protein M0033_10850 [Nitrospiraceae bacterium]|nr:hypothetical protein [Nitrospiraceae bacterium]
MTIAKTLPWSIALHLLLFGAIIAASGRAVPYGGAFTSGPLIVNLGVNLEHAAPAIMPAAAAQATVIIHKKTVIHKKTAPTPSPLQANAGAAAAQPQAQAPQVKSPQAAGKNTPFQNMRMHPPMRMWMPLYVRTNPWLMMPQKTMFLNNLRATLLALIAGKIKKEDGGGPDWPAASVILSYGPDGKLSAVKVSSESGDLKTLLEGVDWQAAPLPSAYKLSLKGLALNIRVDKDAYSIGMKAF